MDYYNNYERSYETMDSVLVGILSIYLIVLVVLFIFYVVSYVFKGIGMYTIAKRQGADYPWLAFVPFARAYLQGELAGNIQLKSKSIKNPGIWLLALPFIGGAVNFIFYILFWIVGFAGFFAGGYYLSSYGSSSGLSTGAILGMLVVGMIWITVAVLYGAVYKVLCVLVNYHILERFTTKNMAIAHSVLCKVIPLYESICLFVMRNREFQPGMEPKVQAPLGHEQFVAPEMQVPGVAPVDTMAAETTKAEEEKVPAVIILPSSETEAAPTEDVPLVSIPEVPEMKAEEALEEEVPAATIEPAPENNGKNE